MNDADDDGNGRYALSPHQLPFAAWRAILGRVVHAVITTDLSVKSAGVAFFGLFSVFPSIAALVLIYGLVADVSALEHHLSIGRAVLPDQAYDVLAERLNSLIGTNQTQLGFGLIATLALALWSGSRGVSALIDLIGDSYRQPDARNFIIKAILSICMMLGAMCVLGVALAGIALLPLLIAALEPPFGVESVANLARWPLMLVVVLMALAFLYRLAPDRRPARWRWILPGAVAATLLWWAGSLGLSVYVENFSNYDVAFGPLSAVIVLMLWLYYSTLIIALGAELNAALELHVATDTTIGPGRSRGQRGAYVADHVIE